MDKQPRKVPLQDTPKDEDGKEAVSFQGLDEREGSEEEEESE